MLLVIRKTTERFELLDVELLYGKTGLPKGLIPASEASSVHSICSSLTGASGVDGRTEEKTVVTLASI